MNDAETTQFDERLTSIELLIYTIDIVAAYVSSNSVSVEEIPQVMNQAYQALTRISKHGCAMIDRPQPAVPIKKSILDDYIICLEDGKKLKMLKRHLKTSYNMTPAQYRERWNLEADYPMVSPNYAKKRSSLALKIGLGLHRKVLKAA